MVDLLFGNLQEARRRPRQFRYNKVPFELYTDEELRVRFRFGRESIGFITDVLTDDLQRKTRRNHALQPVDQVLIALRFFASGSFLQVVGDTIGVDKSTVSRVVMDVARALVAKQHRFIQWPTTNAELLRNKNAFYQRGGFPSVIGCVDGTHIRIQAPHYDENGYVNRKGFHSINVQGICNTEGKLIDS